MTSPKKGFKKLFPQLVEERPGMTAEDYARWALQDGRAASNSKDPVFSLRSTAEKEYREGRLPTVKKLDGRFYPADSYTSDQELSRSLARKLVVVPSDETLRDLDLLIEVKDWTRSEAIEWLIDEGRKARRSDLDNLRIVHNKIKRLKRSTSI